MQTLPRTPSFSLYTATIGEIRANAPTKRPEKEGCVKLWENNEECVIPGNQTHELGVQHHTLLAEPLEQMMGFGY